ncbi:Mce family protein [Gordonia araii NBRC 100433]|uniref:Mce family protein n=1 Tax=Gordonia araii NBRC 100433 TaxID=1073574 RepID=G7H7H7_9ACTN|nr:MlaD family protein [Gordonia araii]NNG98485.1 MCE family protein [Gordonia araii NBRC 100433]GAB11802.1 Mce family protein [Gordonia araii NBRC 100433]
MRWTKSATVAIVAATSAGLLSACSGLQSVPLPGGASVGDNPQTFRVKFDDILDLVPQSLVKKDGIVVGRVTDITIEPDEWQATVKMAVRDNVKLSNQVHAAVQQTALLGEKFVGLTEPEGAQGAAPQNPDSPIAGLDANGQPRTRTATDLEQVLGALSMLLNNGGLNQLQPIVSELTKAMDTATVMRTGSDGKPYPVNKTRSLLRQTDKLITNLNKQRDDIVTAINGLAKLSTRASAQTGQIEQILEQLPAGVQVLEQQRPQFVELLTKLDKLGEVGTDVLGKSREAIISDLKALRPILASLAKAMPDFITAAPLMLTVPFPDWLTPAAKGDAVNLFMTLDLRLLNQLEALGVGQGAPIYSPPKARNIPVDRANPYYKGNGPRWGWPSVGLLPPPPNSRIGPWTPPSYGNYRPDLRYPAAKQRQQRRPQYIVLTPPKTGQTAIDGPLSMLGER